LYIWECSDPDFTAFVILINEFYSDPGIILDSPRKLDPGSTELFDQFDPIAYPYRHLFTLLDVPAIQLSLHYDEMGPDLTTVPPHAITSMCTNKLAFNTYLRTHGFEKNTPKVYPSIDNLTLEDFPGKVKFWRFDSRTSVQNLAKTQVR
jgi:hypothetical protein